MKIAIIGSRDYDNMERVRAYVNALPENTIVVFGGARGVDKVAQHEAQKRGLSLVVINADWDTYDALAGFLRNTKILEVEKVDFVVAFWDFESPGTKQMIEVAKRLGVPGVINPTSFSYPPKQQKRKAPNRTLVAKEN